MSLTCSFRSVGPTHCGIRLYRGTPFTFYKQFVGSQQGDPVAAAQNSDHLYGGDRFRTPNIRLSLKQYSVGINMFAGDPGLNKQLREDGIDIIDGQDKYLGGKANKYRAGILYAGYGNFRAGINSERVRNFVQNKVVHNLLGVAYFQQLNNKIYPYLRFGTTNPYSTW